MRKALYAGSFDIFTKGHEDILERSLLLFDHVTLLIAVSPNKQTLFSLEERVEMLKKLYQNKNNISVDSTDGMVVDYAKKNGINAIIRGLRPTGDFENEFQLASMNKKLVSDVETIFLMTGGEYFFVSSSYIREIWGHGGDVSKFVPSVIFDYLKLKKERMK